MPFCRLFRINILTSPEFCILFLSVLSFTARQCITLVYRSIIFVHIRNVMRMVEIGEKRNFDLMTATELWDEIKRRKVTVTEEYFATEEILRREGFSIEPKDQLQSPKATPQPVPKSESEVPEAFYQRASLHDIPISPFQGGNPYPAGRYSKIGVSKMKEFISGHMKFYEKGITKQEEVEQVGMRNIFSSLF